MRLTLVRNDRLFFAALPDGAPGRYLLRDLDAAGSLREVVALNGDGKSWRATALSGCMFSEADGKTVRFLESVQVDGRYTLLYPSGEATTLLLSPVAEEDLAFTKIGLRDDTSLSIGRDSSCALVFDDPFVSGVHARLDYEHGVFSIADLESSNGVYVNGKALAPGGRAGLSCGDVVWIMGLRLTVGHRFFAFNNPSSRVHLNPIDGRVPFSPQAHAKPRDERFTCERKPFSRSPRLMRELVPASFSLEEPPAKKERDEESALMKMGPSLLMGLASAGMMAYMAFSMLGGSSDGASLLRFLPMGLMTLAMLASALLWPSLSRRFEGRREEEEEARRRNSYAAYLDRFRRAVAAEVDSQRSILQENRVSVEECRRRMHECDRSLYERTPAQADFLDLRVGRGDAGLQADFRMPARKLELEEDKLRDEMFEVAKQDWSVRDVALSVSLPKNPVVGLLGTRELTRSFARGLIEQICALHSPDEVKLAFAVDAAERCEWEGVLHGAHVFDDARRMRLLATDVDGAGELSLFLSRLLSERLDSSLHPPGAWPVSYVLFCAGNALENRSEMLKTALASQGRAGVYAVCLAEDIAQLPKECCRIVELASRGEGVSYGRDDVYGSRESFVPDIWTDADELSADIACLSAAELDVSSAAEEIPGSLGFLQMFEAGSVEHLNIAERWAKSNPVVSLAAPIGQGAGGAPLSLDVHERAHGPHGLVAGTTGSGKSEWLITWILSLSVCYRPDEVSFVLIDYKGGGLAGAFDNEQSRLPHLAGTITNLDGAAVARSMVSIDSELRRRQALFNEAREMAGTGTMDIYGYQELYRAGKVQTPVPHLMIVSDEFAELKSQQPEFMDSLISAARVGRSLGVHLVLATQKPTGVVNDQIWSNARFKACLKVADAADSKEMLKRPDAAAIGRAGRFFLQVGYDELFECGQGAWAGAPYVPADSFEPPRDDAVELICASGAPLAQARPSSAGKSTGVPESVAVLSEIYRAADEAGGLSAPRLWCEPLPAHITLDQLETRYSNDMPRLREDPFALSAVVGELDDPANQQRRLLALDLSDAGNVALYATTGSGSEAVLVAMLVSLLQTHGADTLNVYLADFGSGAFAALEDAPQVGGFCTLYDEEGVRRLFDFLEKEMRERTALIGGYGGDFGRYARDGGRPAILVVINQIASFIEVYGDAYEQRLVKIAREGSRCGIHLLVTATSTMDVRMRLRQCFSRALAFELNDEREYMDIVGSMRGVAPPEGSGRGLVNMGNGPLLFQGASVAMLGADDFAAARALCAGLDAGSGCAVAVPRMPSPLSGAMLDGFFDGDFANIPVGLAHADLAPVFVDMRSCLLTRLAAKDVADAAPVAQGLICRAAQAGAEVSVLDPGGLFPDLPENVRVLKDAGEAETAFSEFVESRDEKGMRLCVVAGSPLLLSLLEKGGIASSLTAQRTSSGVRYLFVTDGRGLADYSGNFALSPVVKKGEGIWIGSGIAAQGAVFDLGLTLAGRLPECRADDGFVISGAEAVHVRFALEGNGGNEYV